MPWAVVQIVLGPATPEAAEVDALQVESVHGHGRSRDLVAGKPAASEKPFKERGPV